MKPVSPKRSAAGAVVLVLVALATSRRGAFAFAPAGAGAKAKAKGRDADAPLASTVALAPEVRTARSTRSRPRGAARRGNRGNRNGRAVVRNAPRRAAGTSRATKPLEDLRMGSSVSGRVVSVCDFGAFVDIGHATRGCGALLHASQLSEGGVDDIRKHVRVGDAVEGARVIRLDWGKGEVGLSLRPPRRDRKDLGELTTGARVEGRVASVVPYGAFVDVGASVNALLHVSRITGDVVENIRHHLNEGDAVSVHILDIDKRRNTMAVSMLDEKTDQYLDRRMSQRLKRYYGSAASEAAAGASKNMEYFDRAIHLLEDVLRGRWG